MKKFFLLFTISVCSHFIIAQSSFEEGDKCFNQGDYKCALTYYKKALEFAQGEVIRAANLKIKRSNYCNEKLEIADTAFKNGNFQTAKENYELVIEENPNDSYAKSQLEESVKAISRIVNLSVSKTNFDIEAKETIISINVSTNAGEYFINSLPYWCEVVNKYPGWFTLRVKTNNTSNLRKDWFRIVAKDKEVRIYLSQEGKSESTVSRPVYVEPKNNVSYQKPQKQKKIKNKTSNSYNSFFAIGYEGGEIANYGLRMEFGGKKFVGMFLNARSTFISDTDIINSGFIENKNEAIIGLNFKIHRSVFLNLGGGYGYYKYSIGGQQLERENFYPAYGGLTFRLGRRINLSGGASFMNIVDSFDANVYNPEFTLGLTINLKR